MHGDRQAEAAAKRVQRPSTSKSPVTKSGSSLSILRRSNKEKNYVVRPTAVYQYNTSIIPVRPHQLFSYGLLYDTIVLLPVQCIHITSKKRIGRCLINLLLIA